MSDLRSYVYPWTRLTFPHRQHDQVDRDGHGWVTSAGPWQTPEVKSLSERRDTHVVVLLGERGVGKSRILQVEYESLRDGMLSRVVDVGLRVRREWGADPGKGEDVVPGVSAEGQRRAT